MLVLPRSSLLRVVAPLAAAACVLLETHAALACAPEPEARWVPQRSWPSSCEPDAYTDGIVLLDGDAIPSYTLGGEGQLEVKIQRMVDGAAVETFDGQVSYPDANSALFKSDRPLAPSTDYMITAFRAGSDGAPRGDVFTSAFTTGTRSLSPLTFAAEPTLRYEESDRKRHTCSADACGQTRCETTDELVHVRSLRVAVPEITGGIEGKPYRVSAQLVTTMATSQATAVATTDSAATQADKRSFIVLDLPPLPETAEGCVVVHVEDVAGSTFDSEPVCMTFDPDTQQQLARVDDDLGSQQVKISTQPPVDEAQEELEFSTSTEHATAVPEVEHASAGGCAIGRSGQGAGVVGWLGLAMTLARLRPRKRSR